MTDSPSDSSSALDDQTLQCMAHHAFESGACGSASLQEIRMMVASLLQSDPERRLTVDSIGAALQAQRQHLAQK